MRIGFYRATCSLLLAGLIGCGSSPPPGAPNVVLAEEAPAKNDPVPDEVTAKSEQTPQDGVAFAFPADAGGKALEKLLPPGDPGRLPSPAPRGPIDRSIPPLIERPTLLASPQPAPPSLPQPGAIAIRPSPPPERVPTDLARPIPELPARIELPVGGVMRFPSPDPRQPAPLPALAKQVPDRASLDDPTADFTIRSVTGAPLPIRQTTAPFVKVNLPEPFEFAESARLRLDRPEDPNKVLGSPPPTKP